MRKQLGDNAGTDAGLRRLFDMHATRQYNLADQATWPASIRSNFGWFATCRVSRRQRSGHRPGQRRSPP
ncbi:MAG: hypothetical protein IPF44_09655 [Betaproteobacteria bacterium]|nr:hypothetical protein [Betaproteobacteria bacterium]